MAAPKLTPNQKNFALLVATGLYTDVRAYQEAFRSGEANARKNAWKVRKMPLVGEEIQKIEQAHLMAQQRFLDLGTCRGRLADIIYHGKDADSIRAILALAIIDREQRELGATAGNASTFDELLERIAQRPRLLPCEDPDDNIPIDA